MCDPKNWIMVQQPDGAHWYYVQDPSCSVLLSVNRIFWDYQLLNCDWHAVVFGMWSLLLPGLKRELGKAYIQWSEEMLASDSEEEEEEEEQPDDEESAEGKENLPPHSVVRLFLPKNLFSDEE